MGLMKEKNKPIVINGISEAIEYKENEDNSAEVIEVEEKEDNSEEEQLYNGIEDQYQRVREEQQLNNNIQDQYQRVTDTNVNMSPEELKTAIQALMQQFKEQQPPEYKPPLALEYFPTGSNTNQETK